MSEQHKLILEGLKGNIGHIVWMVRETGASRKSLRMGTYNKNRLY